MEQLQVFNFNENEVRTAKKDNDIWFCLKDVCDILELDQVSRVKSRLKQDGVIIIKVIDKLGREQEANFINESNLYKTIFQSRKPQAEKFTDWVTSEVLPAIRKTGRYEIPKTPMDAIKLMIEAQEQTNERVEKIDYRVKDLEDNKLLSPGEYNYISRVVKKKVRQVKIELDMNLNQKQTSQIYHAINRDLNCFIGIKTRSQFKAKDFDKAIGFIENWELSYTDKKIIEKTNDE